MQANNNQMFKLESKYYPTGDQPDAILKLTKNLDKQVKHQTLWGVTGSGKTFTMANIIANQNKPTLVIAHNKTLAAQLADEFRSFFPNNAVHYFVSYYDYYQPEAYIPQTDTYVEKDSSINDEIDRLRHAATHALLTRKDVIIVASVSCIYGIGSPEFYHGQNFTFSKDVEIKRDFYLRALANLQFERNDIELKRGSYRLRGDTLEIFPAYSNNSYRIEFFGNAVEKISEIDWITGKTINDLENFEVFPAKHFVTPENIQKEAIKNIRADLENQLKRFNDEGKILEAERLKQRTNYDIEMIEQTGYCNGIENYSRYFDKRKPGQPASTLLNYFPDDYLLFIDESHMTIPQIGAMYYGDLSRKNKLVDYGFRLPSAYDNRPLTYNEFYRLTKNIVFVSATPADYEIKKSSAENAIYDDTIGRDSIKLIPKKYDAIIRQFIRPTGLLDPEIEIRKTKGQIEDLITEIEKRIEKKQRVLITTLTKKMSEALTDFLIDRNIKVSYIHSGVDTLERMEILQSLRLGKYDVLIGINLLREGLDLPEVSLIAILDADKEGFLRSKTSLIQTIGRAARHSEGKVIMYADFITKSMKAAIDETIERRKLQTEYNQKNNIIPKSISKEIRLIDEKEIEKEIEIDREFAKLPKSEKKHAIKEMECLMQKAADNLEFEKAAIIRDQIALMEELLSSRRSAKHF